MRSIKIGFAPTRRSIFSAPDAVKFANLTRDRLKELGVEFVDIDDINEEGLLYQECDRIRIREKFRAAGIDGLFFPHGNFGTEFEVARLAKEMGVPVLLWGPGMSGRSPTVSASAIPSAACSPPARCCAGSGFRSPI